MLRVVKEKKEALAFLYKENLFGGYSDRRSLKDKEEAIPHYFYVPNKEDVKIPVYFHKSQNEDKTFSSKYLIYLPEPDENPFYKVKEMNVFVSNLKANVLIPHFRGSGLFITRDLSFEKVYEDLEALFKFFLEEAKIPKEDLFVYAARQVCPFAVEAAKKASITNLVLDCPVPYLNIKPEITLGNHFCSIFEGEKLFEVNLEDFKGNLTVLSNKSDQWYTPELTKQVSDSFTGEKTVLEYHNDICSKRANYLTQIEIDKMLNTIVNKAASNTLKSIEWEIPFSTQDETIKKAISKAEDYVLYENN